MNNSLRLTSLLTLFLICLFTSCRDDSSNLIATMMDDEEMGGGGGGMTGNEGPQLQIRLTDSPGEYEQVLIDVADVEIKVDNSDFQQLDTDYPGVYDVLELTNGVDTLLAETSLEPTTVKEVRLTLGSDNSVRVAGQSLPLGTPADGQSGLRVIFPAEVELLPNRSYVLTLDFDAGRSVLPAGNGDEYELRPVMRAYIRQVDPQPMATETGMTGELDPGTFHYVQAISPGGDTLSTYTDPGGRFAFADLTPGIWTIIVEAPPGAPYGDYETDNVEIRTGEINDLNVIRLQ